MANRYVAEVYAERIDRLALGIEPVDAGTAGRVARTVRVQLEDVPQPFTPIASARSRCAYDAGLPDIGRHPTSRYVLLYPGDGSDPKIPVTIRLFDCARWFVPRRLRIPVLSLAQVLATEEAAAGPVIPPELLPPQPPLDARVRRPALYPGAAYQIDATATGLRGRVLRGGRPMRWARVEARDPASGALLGRAHGDDRGEFFLIVGSVATPSNVVRLADPVATAVQVFGPTVVPVPVPAGVDRTRLDPFWDLPVEVAPAPGDPDPVSPGDVLPIGYVGNAAGPLPVQLPVGQITSAIAPFVFA